MKKMLMINKPKKLEFKIRSLFVRNQKWFWMDATRDCINIHKNPYLGLNVLQIKHHFKHVQSK